MSHQDIILLLAGSFLPNNLLLWSLRKVLPTRKPKPKPERGVFARLAIFCGNAFGSPFNFGLWILLVSGWLWLGSSFHYSDTWQLLINTPTTIIELFAAILIQYVGNRIERRQEEHEEKMFKMLEEVRNLSELLAANLEGSTVEQKTVMTETDIEPPLWNVPDTADMLEP